MQYIIIGHLFIYTHFFIILDYSIRFLHIAPLTDLSCCTIAVPGLCDLAAPSASETTTLPEGISGPSFGNILLVMVKSTSSITDCITLCFLCEAGHYNTYLLCCGDDISKVTSGIWCHAGSAFHLAAGYLKNTNESL